MISYASWENIAVSRDVVLPYNVPADPQYWGTYLRLKNIPPDVSGSRHTLIDVSLYAILFALDPTVNTAGFVSAQLLYNIPASGGSSDDISPTDEGNILPGAYGNPDVLSVAAESYDPLSLPVGGADFPIFTRSAIDTLTARTYVSDADNPGPLWGFCQVQVNGSNNAITDAVTVRMQMSWRPVQQ